MARLTEAERRAMAESAKQPPQWQPQLEQKSVAAYIEFATFASRFTRGDKPVRFIGSHWKL